MFPALYKKVGQSVNVRILAYAYLLSTAFQFVWWTYFLHFNLYRLIDLLDKMFSAWWLSKIFAVFICVALLMFASITWHTSKIGLSLLRLSRDPTVKLSQSSRQRFHSFLAIGCLLVTLMAAVLIPSLSDSDGVVAYLATHLSGIVLFGYNLFAIQLYEGWDKRRV